jgi:hypothetical protein
MVAMVFDTDIPEGAAALRGTLDPGAMLAFYACVAWVALAETLHVFPGRPNTCISFPPLCCLFAHLSARLQATAIGYTGMLKNPIHLTSIRHHQDTNLMLPAGIMPNSVHHGKLHPRLEAIIHLV